jgi:hypothetical protein
LIDDHSKRMAAKLNFGTKNEENERL